MFISIVTDAGKMQNVAGKARLFVHLSLHICWERILLIIIIIIIIIDIPDPLSRLLPIVPRLWKVVRATSRILT